MDGSMCADAGVKGVCGVCDILHLAPECLLIMSDPHGTQEMLLSPKQLRCHFMANIKDFCLKYLQV